MEHAEMTQHHGGRSEEEYTSLLSSMASMAAREQAVLSVYRSIRSYVLVQQFIANYTVTASSYLSAMQFAAIYTYPQILGVLRMHPTTSRCTASQLGGFHLYR